MKVSEVQAGSEFPWTDEDTEITSSLVSMDCRRINLLIFFSDEP